MSDRPSLTVILPIYNEIEILERNLRVIDAFLAAHFGDYEILIVESASSDGTAQACDRLVQVMPHVRVIHEAGRNGIGSATRLGFQAATKDWAWRYAIDLPCPLEAILEALPLFDANDCVLSYRSHDDRGGFRKLQSAVFNFVVKQVLSIKVTHVNSAFKVFRTNLIQKFPLHSNTGFVDTEMVYWTFRHGLRWVEIPVALTERTGGQSSVTLSDPLHYLKELVRLVRTGSGK
jgi:glycosyltransferase involved in cell wall biosynthesis